VTGWADNVEMAIDTVYANVKKVSFEGMQFRSDIAHRALL
jgi:phosphoribosylamine-glycine ligase